VRENVSKQKRNFKDCLGDSLFVALLRLFIPTKNNLMCLEIFSLSRIFTYIISILCIYININVTFVNFASGVAIGVEGKLASRKG
jgi:hypothetical protein